MNTNKSNWFVIFLIIVVLSITISLFVVYSKQISSLLMGANKTTTTIKPITKMMSDTAMVPATTTIKPITKMMRDTAMVPATTTTLLPMTTTLIPMTTTLLPTTILYPLLDMTLWLDASSSGSWSAGSWVNTVSGSSSNATTLTGTWSTSSLVSKAINNLSALFFSGSNALSISNPAGTYSSGMTMFISFRPTGSDTYKTLLSRTNPSIPSPFDMYNNVRMIGNGSKYSLFYSPTNLNTLTLNRNYLFALRISVSETDAYLTEWLNGSIQYNKLKLTNYSDTGTTLTIGGRADKIACFFTGYMGEVMVYKNALTDTEVSSVSSYLSGKWGVTMMTSFSSTIEARYVAVERVDGSATHIPLAEIQVFDTTGNQITIVSASSNGVNTGTPTYLPSNVYDGDPNTYTNTTAATDAYVKVDLNQNYTIGKVLVLNRIGGTTISNMVGCVLRLYNNLGQNTYTSNTITEGTYTYEFIMGNSVLTITYLGNSGSEQIQVATNLETLLETTTATTIATTKTYTLKYKPQYVNITYSNDSTNNDLYIKKLEYNGNDLIAAYTNTTEKYQTAVRAGLLAWPMTYTFTI